MTYHDFLLLVNCHKNKFMMRKKIISDYYYLVLLLFEKKVASFRWGTKKDVTYKKLGYNEIWTIFQIWVKKNFVRSKFF